MSKRPKYDNAAGENAHKVAPSPLNDFEGKLEVGEELEFDSDVAAGGPLTGTIKRLLVNVFDDVPAVALAAGILEDGRWFSVAHNSVLAYTSPREMAEALLASGYSPELTILGCLHWLRIDDAAVQATCRRVEKRAAAPVGARPSNS